MEPSNNWYNVTSHVEIDSPALLIYPERIQSNIDRIKVMLSDTEKIRPHVKTCKSKEPIKLLMNAGIKKFKCATIAEAEMLAICGAADVLLAYQLNETKLYRFIQLIKAYPSTLFSCLVDNESSAFLASKIAFKLNVCIYVWIDLNVGMNRTGIKPGIESIELYDKVSSLPAIKFSGLHAYDGHIFESDLEKRILFTNKAFLAVEEMRIKLVSRGNQFPILIAGGTPTFSIHSDRNSVQLSPGTFVLWDKGYQDLFAELDFSFAAIVLTRVISIPTEDTLCIDMGHKSIAAENEISARVYFLNAPELYPLKHSEEHMVVHAGRAHKFKIGDILYALPVHICPTVALYEKAYCIQSGNLIETWEITARDRMINV